MGFQKLTVRDLVGSFYLTVRDSSLADYYNTLSLMQSFLRREQWHQCVTGYYVNRDKDGFRLSYFAQSSSAAEAEITRFVAEPGTPSLRRSAPPCGNVVFSKDYGGDELRFRRYLSTYTRIGLDIMQNDLHHARCLFAFFRLNIMLAKEAFEPYLVPTFERLSPFYLSMSRPDRQRFWEDFSCWPNLNQVDWAHLFVNMVLGSDWINNQLERFHTYRGPGLSIREINCYTASMQLTIDEDWTPN